MDARTPTNQRLHTINQMLKSPATDTKSAISTPLKPRSSFPLRSPTQQQQQQLPADSSPFVNFKLSSATSGQLLCTPPAPQRPSLRHNPLHGNEENRSSSNLLELLKLCTTQSPRHQHDAADVSFNSAASMQPDGSSMEWQWPELRFIYPPSAHEITTQQNYYEMECAVVDRIGRGVSAQVYKCHYQARQVVAVKVRHLSGYYDRQAALEEVQILQQLIGKQQHVLQLVQAWEQRGTVYMMTRYYAGGDLSQMSHVVDRQRVAVDVLRGLECIHAHGIMHLDLKPSNILCDQYHGTFVIADFGLAYQSSLRGGGIVARDLEREGDRRYIAREVLAEGVYTQQADLFSFGLVLVQLIEQVSQMPDSGDEWHRLRSDYVVDGYPLVTRMLSSQYRDRHTAAWYLRQLV